MHHPELCSMEHDKTMFRVCVAHIRQLSRVATRLQDCAHLYINICLVKPEGDEQLRRLAMKANSLLMANQVWHQCRH